MFDPLILPKIKDAKSGKAIRKINIKYPTIDKSFESTDSHEYGKDDCSFGGFIMYS